MRAVAAALLFLPAACSSAPSAPPITYTPPASTPDIPPSFVASFSSPSMAVAGWCEEQTPVPCDVPPGAVWASFNRPGNAGQACSDPNPNPCYSVSSGVLTTRNDAAFPITTVRTFDRSKTIRVSMRTSAEACGDPGCWAGIVIYDGEQAYAGEYWRLSPNPGRFEVHAYRTRVEVPVSADVYDEGSSHTFDLTWKPDGTIIYAVDGVPKCTETAASPMGPDSVFLAHDPHISIFSGGMALSVYSLTVTEEP